LLEVDEEGGKDVVMSLILGPDKIFGTSEVNSVFDRLQIRSHDNILPFYRN